MSEYFNNILYGVNSFITGLKVTWGHFINKKDLIATLQYPHEKWPIPERNIGFDHSEYNLIRSRLHVDIDDCIACMQCERACPVDCIKIDSIKPPKDNGFDCGMTSNDTQKKMIVSRFTIDMSECMYCNLCVYPCPEECIYMVGGPNEKKHAIDYEFSQYKRDGMIFEFAEATDDEIRECGGERWLEKRDEKLKKNAEGVELMGAVMGIPIGEEVKPAVETKLETTTQVAIPKAAGGDLAITSFNDISDKMCRGIAKKAFMAASREGKDETAILMDVTKALSDGKKMTDEIQTILDGFSKSSLKGIGTVEDGEVVKSKSINEAELHADVKDFDIKDLNIIEDKMVRGIAKKSFLAAKRADVDKVAAIRTALSDVGKLDAATEELLDSFSTATMEVSKSSDVEIQDKPVKNVLNESLTIPDQGGDLLPLFEITKLNVIDDKMTRGIAKKIFTVGKRAEKTRIEVITDIRDSLKSAGKLDDSTATILANLEKEN